MSVRTFKISTVIYQSFYLINHSTPFVKVCQESAFTHRKFRGYNTVNAPRPATLYIRFPTHHYMQFRPEYNSDAKRHSQNTTSEGDRPKVKTKTI